MLEAFSKYYSCRKNQRIAFVCFTGGGNRILAFNNYCACQRAYSYILYNRHSFAGDRNGTFHARSADVDDADGSVRWL